MTILCVAKLQFASPMVSASRFVDLTYHNRCIPTSVSLRSTRHQRDAGKDIGNLGSRKDGQITNVFLGTKEATIEPAVCGKTITADDEGWNANRRFVSGTT